MKNRSQLIQHKLGACQCEPGYAGDDCLWDENHVPSLYDLPQGATCDLAERACGSQPVEGYEFYNVATLTCVAAADNVSDTRCSPIDC